MSNEKPTTPAKAGYDISEPLGGIANIVRDGIIVATYDTGTQGVLVKADMGRYRPTILRWLASQKIEVSGSEIEIENGKPPLPPPSTPLPVAGTTANPAPVPGIPTPPASGPAAGARPPSMDRKFAPYKHPKHPDGPDLDPRFGDKTPAFVAWLEEKNKGGK